MLHPRLVYRIRNLPTETITEYLVQYESGTLTEPPLPAVIDLMRQTLRDREKKRQLRQAYPYQVLTQMSTGDLTRLLRQWLRPDLADVYGNTARKILLILRQREAAEPRPLTPEREKFLEGYRKILSEEYPDEF